MSGSVIMLSCLSPLFPLPPPRAALDGEVPVPSFSPHAGADEGSRQGMVHAHTLHCLRQRWQCVCVCVLIVAATQAGSSEPPVFAQCHFSPIQDMYGHSLLVILFCPPPIPPIPPAASFQAQLMTATLRILSATPRKPLLLPSESSPSSVPAHWRTSRPCTASCRSCSTPVSGCDMGGGLLRLSVMWFCLAVTPPPPPFLQLVRT